MGNARLERRPEARAFSVETLLQHVRDGKIRIPDFQRPLRWRANHVLDLFDSVYRGFPVGDLLLFKRPADTATIHFGPVGVHAPAVPDAHFVVDGQQRITALAGAMLHPEPRPYGDVYAVWFDLEEERFVRGRQEPSAQWIPLNVVADSAALFNWLDAWPFRSQRRDLVQRAFALGKALREYQIPAYIVEGASDEVLRLIFKRVNTSGVRMEETEVFTALFGGSESRPIERACARLQTATGFGELSSEDFLVCLKVIERLNLANEFDETEAAKLDPLAVEHTENALLRAIRFLLDDAGVIHLQMLPHPFSFLVLARFFHLHPRPTPRTRTLLSRWLWRAVFSLFGDQALQASGTLDGDEFASVERLLRGVPATPVFPLSSSSLWSSQTFGINRLWAVAIAHLGPRDPETGAVLDGDEIRALLQRVSINDAFLDVGGWADSTVVRRVLVSSHDKLEKLPYAPLQVLESHGLDQQAADALGRGDIETFTKRRAAILDRWFERFLIARVGADDSGRPPIDELIRRVDKALTAP
jgi:hypothetical protein